MMFRVILCMSPLEKVPFATFYPSWKYLCGTYFSKKRLFQVDSCIQFYRLMQLVIFMFLKDNFEAALICLFEDYFTPEEHFKQIKTASLFFT